MTANFGVSTFDASTVTTDLPADLDAERMPSHVAVIMDGNGRWAKRRGLPRIMGHRKGVDTLKKLLRCCRDWGIGALTAYAFSTENWGRPTREVDFLMTLFERVLRQELKEMMDNKEDFQLIDKELSGTNTYNINNITTYML